jgi:transposase
MADALLPVRASLRQKPFAAWRQCHGHSATDGTAFTFLGFTYIWGKSRAGKQCRRVATRYDKLAVNYLAFIQLASIKLWLRVNESTP